MKKISFSPVNGNRLFVFCLVLSIQILSTVNAGNRIVRVGVYENSPKIFTNEHGRPDGFFIDIIEYIAGQEGWTLEYCPGMWSEGLERLEKGEIDLMPDVAYTAGREDIFDFHKEAVLTSWVQVYSRKGSGIRSILDLAGKRVLVLERSVQQETFTQLMKSFDLNIFLLPMPDYNSIFKEVKSGNADAAITNRFFGLMHAAEYGLEDTSVIFNPTELFFASTEGRNLELLEAVDKNLKSLKKDLKSLYYISLRKWTTEKVIFQMPGWLKILLLTICSVFLISVIVSIILKKQVKNRTVELYSLNRIFRTMSECNHALLINDDVTELIKAICRILIETGGYNLAGTEIFDPLEKELTPYFLKAVSGKNPEVLMKNYVFIENGYYSEITEKVFKTGRYVKDQNIAGSPFFNAWKNDASLEGYEAVLVLPFKYGENILGVLLISSSESLGDDEIEQLEKIADNLAFGITSYRNSIAKKAAEKESLLAWRQFEDIVEFLPDATFVINQDSKVIAWNHACEEMTGVKKEKMIGKGDYSYSEPFFGERRPMLIDFLDIQELENDNIYKNAIRKNNRVYNESFHQILNNGKGAYIKGVASPLFDQEGRRSGAIESIQDITEQKNIIKALFASEKKYRELVMLANSIILRWSADGRIIFMNEYGLNFFGYSEDELTDKSLIGTIVPEKSSLGDNLKTMIEDISLRPLEYMQNINENIRRDGKKVWIDWRNRIVTDESGNVKEVLSIGSDITELKKAEEEILKLNQALRHHSETLEKSIVERTEELLVAKEQAESADRLKSAFLAAMSHELRTPLNSIIGFTGILLQKLPGPINEEQQKQLKMVQNSSHHLLSLINDVLDISKIESGQLKLSKSTFVMKDSIEKVVQIVTPLAEKKGIELKLEISSGKEEVTTDQRRMEQIIMNLLNNAVKFTENGHITVSFIKDEGMYHLSVSDTGIGISSDEIAGLFQPFHQIDTGLARRQEGTGLGLSICKKLIEMMNGTISVESREGKGSVFTIHFLPDTGEAA